MLNNDQETLTSVEIIEEEIRRASNQITLIYEDFLLEEKMKNDLFMKYDIQSVLYDNEIIEEDLFKSKNSCCFLVDYFVYKKNRSLLRKLKESSPEALIIIVSDRDIKEESIEDLNHVFTLVQNYEKNKITLFLAIRNAIKTFLSNHLFEKHIKAFENYAFYMRENDLLNVNNAIKNLKNYFNIISDENSSFRFVVIECSQEEPVVLGGNHSLINEFKKKESKEANTLKTILKKTIEEEVGLDCGKYNTFYFTDLYNHSIVFILEDLDTLTYTNKKLSELIISTSSNFIFSSINERNRVEFYLERMIKVCQEINYIDTERDLIIFKNLFEDISVSHLAQNRVLFFHLSAEAAKLLLRNNVEVFEPEIILNKEELDVYYLFKLIKNKQISITGESEEERLVPISLLMPIVRKYSVYIHI